MPSNQADLTLGHNDVSEPSRVTGASPISAINSDFTGTGGVNFTCEPCAGPAFPNSTRQYIHVSEATSFFESFLWPLDPSFEYYDTGLAGHSGLQTPNMVSTAHQPLNMPPGTTSAVAPALFAQDIQGHGLEAPRLSSMGQSDNHSSETALTEEDRDILISEDYGHVPKPSISTYETICSLHAQANRSSPEAPLPSLYSLDILHACAQLYFEHFHQAFPILHQGTFEARCSSGLLYLAVAAVGSQYSRLSIRTKIFSDLVDVIRLSLLRKVYLTPAIVCVSPGTVNITH